MIELKFKWDEKDLALFDRSAERFSFEINIAIQKIAYHIRNTAIQRISQGSRSGKVYKRGAIIHQASAEGEYPKTNTGRLVSSIRVDLRDMEADIGSDINYAVYLENKQPKLGGRPWLSRAYDESQDEINGFIGTALRRTFNL